MLILALPALSWAPPCPALSCETRGDVNCDGAVDLADTDRLVATLFCAACGICPNQDVNGDALVSAADLLAAANRAPLVDAGADAITPLDQAVTLMGSVHDDGLPKPPLTTTLHWEKISGAGNVQFGAPTAATTTATFSATGSYDLRLTANDGALSGSDEVTVHVDLAAANVAPTLDAVADQTIAAGSALNLRLAGHDGNPFDALTYSLVSGPDGAKVTGDGIFSFAPLAPQLGEHAVTVRVQDQGGLGAERSFQVAVVQGNRPPVIDALADTVIPQGTPFGRQLTASDPDPGDTVAFALVSAPEGMSLAGNQLSWTPSAAQFGTYVVRVQAADASGASASAEFKLVVPAAAPPTARDDSYEAVVGHTLTVPAPGVLANDASVDGSPVIAQQLSQPNKGMVTAFGADGGFTYVAPAAEPTPPLDATIKYQLIGGGVRIGNSAPLVADVDGDGKPDIVFFEGNGVWAARGDTGEILFHADSGLPEPYQGCALYGRGNADHFAAADIDDDGVVEIVTSVQCHVDTPNYIYIAGNATRVVALVYDAEAPTKFRVKWLSDPLSRREPITPEQGGDGHLWVPFGGQTTYTSFTVARLRPNEKPTILFGKTYQGYGGEFSYCGKVVSGKTDPACRFVFVVDGATGAVKQPYYATPDDPAHIDAYEGTPYGNATAAPIVADVDDDGALDILYQGTLWELDGTVKRQFDGTLSTGGGTSDSVVLDLDGDPQMEIVTLENANYRHSAYLTAWKPDGRRLWRLTLPGSTIVTPLSIGDVDRSGRPTILFAIHDTLWAVDVNGNIKWLRKVDLIRGYSWISQAGMEFPVYDLNADGIVEIILQYGKQTILFLRGDTGETQTSWSYPGQFDDLLQSVQAPVIADLDGTGEASLIWYHDINLNDTTLLQVLKGASAPWRAAPTHRNQRAYWGTNFDPDGGVPATYPRHTADPSSNLFAQQPPVPYTLEPRLRTQTSFTYDAHDGGLASSPATVTIDLLPENRPPKLTALPPAVLPTSDYRSETYTFQLGGADPDPGDVLTFGPPGEQLCGFEGRVTISPQGLFTYWGRAGGEEQCYFAVTLSDGNGGSVAAPILIYFTQQQRTVPDVVGFESSAARDEIVRRDLVAGAPFMVVATAPPGQVLAQNPVAGSEVLRGTPVQLTVSLGPGPEDTDADGDGFTPNQGDCDDADPNFNPGLPEIPSNGIDENCDGSERIVREVVIEPASALYVTGEDVDFAAIAIYVDGTSADVTATANWASATTAVATIGPTGRARTLNPGNSAIRATFGGAVGHAGLTVRARNAGDQDPPTAVLTAPADGGTVSGPTQITGTATDANFLRYELAIAPAGESGFTTIGAGSAAVVDGVLGTLDPTLLINQLYTLRLTVFDRNENQEHVEISVQIDGSQKVGNFTLSYSDLVVPLSGLPVRVQRSYDSRDKHAGDFGIGWQLKINTFRVSASRVLGSGWQVVKPGLAYALAPVGDHRVSVTLPSGRVETFDLVLSPTVSPFVPLSAVRARYLARPGTRGTLESVDNNELRIVDPQPGPVTLLDDTTLNDYHPQRFRYTAPDGTQYVVNRTTGVESVRDSSANQLTFGPGGITHSNGQGVAFTRDTQGRITAITDPKGQMQTYTYSPAGDLASHTDPAGNTTHYSYDRFHGLIRIVDPLGRPVARSEYDDDGRLISVTDAAGHQTAFAHDPDTRQEEVQDALGRTTLVEYDERGNVIAVTDPLGARRTATFDERGNPLTMTDPLGGTTTLTYDANGAILSVTDPLGQMTAFTRDANGRPLTITDPRGSTTTMQYDDRGQLLVSIDALGGTTSSTYDGGGNITSLTDSSGATSHSQYDAAGRRVQLTDAMGEVTTMQYDANGNVTGQHTDGGTAWGVTYGPDNRLTQTTVGGVQRAVSYDALGQVREVSTSTGRRLAVAFDPVGRLASLTTPEGAPVMAQEYDAVGNLVAITDVLRNRIENAYDAANRLIETRGPDGSTERRAYDAAGRLIQTVDARGNATQYAYDAGGRLIGITDALGGTTEYEYDAAGNLTAQVDPVGRRTTHAYDALNRRTATTFPDGTIESRLYNTAGRVAQFTDTGGNTTRYSYDAMGNLLSVTDPLGDVTAYSYQAGGLRSAITDANGHRTAFEYDAAGRQTKVTYPGGEVETWAYDAAGRLSERTNGKGEKVQYEYDGQGRLSTVRLPGGATEGVTYTADQLIETVSSSRGTTTFAYHPTTRRLLRVTEPDGRYVRYAYDAAGNRTRMAHGSPSSDFETRYTFDVLNRLATITDPNGGVTTQTYDAAGNVVSIARPNGVTTELAYDARGRVTSITDRKPGGGVVAGEVYTLDAVGNRTRVDRDDGSHVEYQYDAVGRVVRERHVGSDSALTFESVYAYDAVGNRTASGPPGAPVVHAYNANNQLVSAGGVTYTYDAAGRRVMEAWMDGGPQSVEYTWDAKDRLTAFRDPSAAVTTYDYDADDLRQGKAAAGDPRAYLVDRRNETGFSQIVGESSAQAQRSFVYGAELLHSFEAGTARYRLVDHLGSTRALTDASGATTDTFAYGAYGEALSHVGNSALPHRFTGEEYDAESGLTYLRARYYDPRTGSFLSRDPAVGDPAVPLSLHPYLYALDNPVNRTDPSGRNSIPELLTAAYSRIQAVGQNILRVRDGIEKTEKVIGTTMADLGGILAVFAIVEEFENSHRVLRWFGGGELGATLLEYLNEIGIPLGSGVKVVASAVLGKTALDMLGGRKVEFEVELTTLGNGLANAAFVPGPANASSAQCGQIAGAYAVALPEPVTDLQGQKYWEIHLCRPFFFLKPFPTTLATRSMAGGMVHEYSHLTSSLIDDFDYGCGAVTNLLHGSGDVTSQSGSGAVATRGVRGIALFNADSYACWVEDSAINYGTRRFERAVR